MIAPSHATANGWREKALHIVTAIAEGVMTDAYLHGIQTAGESTACNAQR
jgi:hypothetical protein